MKDLDAIGQPGSDERKVLDSLDLDALPNHVAFIMDGNGRWAKARRLPRVEGHRQGIKTVRRVVEVAAQLELEVVTLYAFSTENWKRPRHEIVTLMRLLKDYINRELDSFISNNLRFRPIGRIDGLDASVQKHLQRAVEATAGCTGTVIQIALNYSGRQELTDLVREAVSLARQGLDPDQVDEGWIDDHLMTAGTPDPDLLVRTSGEQRISNFLLWQLAYSEIYFTPVLWPDFSKIDMLQALLEYQRRDRRYGGLADDEPDTPDTDTGAAGE